MKNKEIANKIKKSAVKYFGNNLSSVLLYGSSVSSRKKPNDLDIIIVLKKRESSEDLCFFRNEKEEYNIEIDLQIINIEDINADFFSHDTHGQFFLSFLRQAIPLYGINPFLSFFSKYTKTRESIIQKAQYYYFRAKKNHSNCTQTDGLEDISFHRKKILLMLADFWLAYSGKNEEIIEKSKLVEIIKKLTGDKPRQSDIDFLLQNNDISLKWGDVFLLYQRYYFSILDRLQLKINLKTFYIDNLYTECHSRGSSNVAIIASGCPSDYDEKEITTFLNVRGYDVVLFHYAATGKSSGSLFTSPQDDLVKVLKFYKKQYKKVIIVGNSYGGYAALSLKKQDISKISKIIAISPAIDFKKIKGFSTFPDYLSSNMPGEYRFEKNDFIKFIKQSNQPIVAQPKIITIIHGKKDKQIKTKSVLEFCKAFKIDHKIIDAGHLSLNRLSREHLDVLDKLL